MSLACELGPGCSNKLIVQTALHLLISSVVAMVRIINDHRSHSLLHHACLKLVKDIATVDVKHNDAQEFMAVIFE